MFAGLVLDPKLCLQNTCINDLSLSPQEDCEAENVWEMGGLGILTSVPITPRVVCFLCASSGHVEVRGAASRYPRQLNGR